MKKSYLYEEYILSNENLCSCRDKLSIELYFDGKLNNKNKIILKNEFEKTKDNHYIVKSELVKYNNENNNIYSAIFYNNYKKKDGDNFNSKLIVDIFCEMNTTNLNESICGFAEINNNSITIKLWNNDNINVGITTSYYVNEDEYDFIIIGGGPSGIYSAYKIATQNPNSRILLLEDNVATLKNYKSKGYDKINKWHIAQLDSDYQKSYLSKDNKTLWVGKGLGGGTLHFGLQYVNNISKNYSEWITNYDIIDKDLNPEKYEYVKQVDGQLKPNKVWYDFKMNLEKYASDKNMNVYNNSIYSTNLINLDRLLLGDLLKNLKNVEIKYNSKVDKLIFTDFKNNKVDSVKTFNNKYYKSNNVILCCGALETPCILQRSRIDCGNKLYDHGAISGLTYGKIKLPPIKENINQDKDSYFILNSKNLELINSISKRYIFRVTGNNLPNNEINKIYDFTNWVNSHPGGSYNITKWRENNNILIFPHSLSRWSNYKSKFKLIGSLDKLIKYKDLPEEIKSKELFNKIILNNDKNKKNNDKLKILVLHGGGSNSEVIKYQEGMQELINNNELNNYEFIFIDSPYNNGMWWPNPISKDQPTTNINHAELSINYLKNYINNNGPFYGLLGYSQGAAMAIVFMAYTDMKFEKVLLYNGYLPLTHLGLMRKINEKKPLSSEPLIFLGEKDPFYKLGLDISGVFENKIEIISNIAGHNLPISNDPTFQKTINYLTNKSDLNVNQVEFMEDLGFENDKIISHLQTRDNDFKWQTYYSTVPGLKNFLILSHSQSVELDGLGSVKIKSLKNENPHVILNHFGNNKEKVINQIYEAYMKNHNFLTNNGYVLLNPNPQQVLIDKKYIEDNLDSIYHYHGSCAIYDVVDENQKVYNVSNLYIGDLSVLNKPWGGSTSYAALNTALNVSKNFIENK